MPGVAVGTSGGRDLARAAGPADWHRLPGRGRDRALGANQRPQGLTTAAAIWLAAILGAAAGAGYYAVGGLAFVLGMALLWLGGRLEMRLHRVLDPINGDKHRNGNDGDAEKPPKGHDRDDDFLL
ncbi:hypothetical protein AWV79_26000 [Cupriavidus sp. UYMMa02A]|nr:hypothetical protein AWV79_26000 [Cupriavidus sp. UYMMa02A]